MLMTRKEVLGRLREACDAAGSVKGWAARHGLHWAYVYNVLLGKKRPAEKILESLGLERVVMYRERK
jgi:hypothetical protein